MLEFIAITIIIAINSLFVISEISILTSAKAKLHKMANNGVKGAKKVIQLTHEPEVFLSTVQVGITLMSALLGLYGGASLGGYIAGKLSLSTIPLLHEYSYFIGSAISLIIITYFTVLSEIVPKRIAMMYPEKIAVLMAYFMFFCTKLIYPFTIILTLSTKYCLKILKIKETNNYLSIEEIKFTINQTEHSGILEKTERDMIKRLINISNMQVGAIMTPRNKIVYLNLQESSEVNANKCRMNPYNHFPVIDNDQNNIIGIAAIKKLFNIPITNKGIKEVASSTNCYYIPEMSKVTKLIELFSQKHVKIAIVLDEYGDIQGLVTVSDIMKTFLGDLIGLVDGKKPGILAKKDGSYLMNGSTLIEEVMDTLHVTCLPDDEIEEYRTLASFILKQLGTVPKIGDFFTACGWIFKVVKMDKFYIEKVLISKSIDNKANIEDT